VFRDKANGDYVVVAVRPGRGTRAAVARLLEDVASVSDLYDTQRVARGVLVATDLDQRAELMLRGAGNLEFARLGDLGLSVEADARSAARPA
jgi:RecB family endonuclease NucS